MAKVHLQIYNTNNNMNKYYRISPRKNNFNFNVNDYVKNNNNLYGIIQEKNKDYMIINWNDNTYERIQIPIVNKNYLIRISKKEYVDTIESQVSPLQTSTINTASIDNIFNNNINDKIYKLVNKAIDKGLIDADEKDTEILKLEAFDKQALQQYENMINNTSYDGEVISLSQDSIDISGLSPQEAEAHNMLHQLKHQRGISSIKHNNIDINNANSRSLKDMNKTAITYANTNNGQQLNMQQVSLDDGLINILNNNSNTNINNDSNNDNNDDSNDMSLDSIIEQIQKDNANGSQFLKTPFNGITKPLLINTSDNINPVNTAFKELFSPEMWTSIGRR